MTATDHGPVTITLSQACDAIVGAHRVANQQARQVCDALLRGRPHELHLEQYRLDLAEIGYRQAVASDVARTLPVEVGA